MLAIPAMLLQEWKFKYDEFVYSPMLSGTSKNASSEDMLCQSIVVHFIPRVYVIPVVGFAGFLCHVCLQEKIL